MKYKLVTEPYNYFNISDKSLIFYNTLDGEKVVSSDLDIVEYFSHLKANNFIVKDEEPEFALDFIGELINKFMISRVEFSSKTPVTFFENNHDLIINDLKKLKQKLTIDSLKYLKKINLYLTSDCDHDCTYCHKAYKQFDCCTKAKKGNIDFNQFKSIINQIYKNTEVTLFGGDISKHKDLVKLVNYLYDNKYYNTHISLKWDTISENTKFIQKLQSVIHISVLADSNQIQTINKHKELFWHPNITLNFVIENKDDYDLIQDNLDPTILEQVDYQLLFNENPGFFKENVYTDEDDLFEQTQSVKEIRTKRLLNSNFFGRLSIFPDGSVHLNNNDNQVSTLSDKTLKQVIEEELITQKSWFKTRQTVEPCNKCLYHDLCPTVSTYELFSGINNMCHYDLDLNSWHNN
ncbi:MAG: 4Fe-4S cluster-binding domain-containing protein [Bacteroidetes bacterium]|nr:4Fe-4S cluster-binding domain-containing protein [Bacteroidota bacterium]